MTTRRPSLMGLVVALLAVLLAAVVVGGVFERPEAAASSDAPADASVTATDHDVELVVFHGDGCPHCANMLAFLDDLQGRYPALVVVDHEVWYDAANQQLFVDTLAALGQEPDAVPTVVLDGIVIVGHSGAIEDRIERIVADLVAGARPTDDGEFVIDVPFAGGVDVGSGSLIGATALIALVDGVNPCSLWVLSMLLALVVHSGSRARVFAVGGCFLLITSVLYGLYMVGAYSALTLVGERAWIRMAVALVAGVFGLLHIKEHWTTRGPSVTIGAEHKPGLFRTMRRLGDMERTLPAALGGTAVLAVGVSLLETPCSAGLPLLWTNLLSDRGVDAGGAVVLFLLYLVVFLIDEFVVFGVAVYTLRAAKLQEHHGRALQLIGGTLMLTLAIAMVFAPASMESIGGTAVVFGIAATVAGAVLLVERRWRRTHPVGRQARRVGARASAR